MNSTDVRVIKDFVRQKMASPFVQARIRRNVEPQQINPTREVVWFVIIGCLLTTQQKSGPDSAVKRFLDLRPFPLGLNHCEQPLVESLARRVLSDFGGIRFTTKIPKQVAFNLGVLKDGTWITVEDQIEKLREQRVRLPSAQDYVRERLAARTVASSLLGFGPKQSRNFWQWLGLTRYEIPIDSRVAKWIKGNLSFSVDDSKLSNSVYYESVVNKLREICAEAGILPCVLDAAMFADPDREWTPDEILDYN
jgi:hypothetical protein